MPACDVTIANENTHFGEPEVHFETGIFAMLLPWVTGPKRANKILLTGEDQLSAKDALRYGVINRVVPDDSVFETGMSVAKSMATCERGGNTNLPNAPMAQVLSHRDRRHASSSAMPSQTPRVRPRIPLTPDMLAREYLRQKFRLLCIVAKNDKTWCGGKRVLLFEDVFLSQNPHEPPCSAGQFGGAQPFASRMRCKLMMSSRCHSNPN